MSVVKIEATYRVVTPLFCSGADPNRPELRLPSFKGVLRFWWRTLAWSRYSGNLETVQKQEDTLFGSASGGQSRISMHLKSVESQQSITSGQVLKIPSTNTVVGEGSRYLGYGVMEAFASKKKGTKAGQLTRACLRAPFDFTVHMRGSKLSNTQLYTLQEALMALGTLGGMGAKSRKGYGSLALRSLSVNGKRRGRPPRSIHELCTVVKMFQVEQEDSGFPKYTALSKGTRHVLVASDGKKPLELLDLIGRELVRYRSWGHNGRILGGKVDSEKRFKDDHDLMQLSKAQRKGHPKRIAFGLPHNYGKPCNKQVGPHDSPLDRRASPLFIHIHECADGPVAVLSFLPAEFLPKGKSDISVGGKRVRQKPEDALYCPIHDFLDRLLDKNECKEQFTQRVEVKL